MILNSLKDRHRTNRLDLILKTLEESILEFSSKNSRIMELDFLSYNSISAELVAEKYIYDWILPYKLFIFNPSIYLEEPPVGSSVIVDIFHEGQTILEKPLEIKPGEYASSPASFKKDIFNKFSRLTFDMVQVGAIFGGSEISFMCDTVELC